MPGDPKECREHAKTCMRLAASAKTTEAAIVFENLASTWLRLAADLGAPAECDWRSHRQGTGSLFCQLHRRLDGWDAATAGPKKLCARRPLATFGERAVTRQS